LLSYLSPLLDPAIFWPIAALGLLAPLLWVLVLLFGVYWMYRSDKAWWLSAVTLALGWGIITTAFAVPKPSSVTEDSFVLASLNGHGFGFRQASEEGIELKIGEYLGSLDADLLCVQEFPRGKYGPRVEAAIKQQNYPYVYRDGDGGLAIFSRFPIRNSAVHYFPNRANGYSWCDIDLGEQTFRLYNLHLQSNTISRQAAEIVADGDLKSRETWSTIKLMFGRYGRSTRVRTQQTRHILAEMRTSPYPLIVAGDFNDVPASYLYRLFREKLQDAHLLGAWGLGATYAGGLPGLRIDYIMPDSNFLVQDFTRRTCFFSDHQAVRAVLASNK